FGPEYVRQTERGFGRFGLAGRRAQTRPEARDDDAHQHAGSETAHAWTPHGKKNGGKKITPTLLSAYRFARHLFAFSTDLLLKNPCTKIAFWPPISVCVPLTVTMWAIISTAALRNSVMPSRRGSCSSSQSR